MTTLFHGSPEDKAILDVREQGLFCGIFCNADIKAAQSHGDYIYTTDISSLDIMDDAFFYDYENSDKVDEALAKIVDFTENDYDMWYDALCLERYDQYDEKWLDLLFVSDPGSVGWKLQCLRGKLAAELGFKAAEMQDEHGISYLVLPGNTLHRYTKE